MQIIYLASMRFWSLPLVVLLLIGCNSTGSSSGELNVNSATFQATGVIVAREIIDLKQLDSNVGSETSGGGTRSVGLESLTSSTGTGYKSDTAMRYKIKLLDGSALSVYSESWRYRVDDCVDVIVSRDNKKKPPEIYLNKNDC
ncbi:MAG: hypothetical protein O6938_01370 [Gammaproteobacteria bacterium]|nr:hypothetical protein [Gammaproteobacteria bacterium]